MTLAATGYMDNAGRAWKLPSVMMKPASLVLPFLAATLLLRSAPSGASSIGRSTATEAALVDTANPESIGEELFRLARDAETRGAYAEAIGRYKACALAAPDSRWAGRASERVEWLRMRSAGDFVPLARLERIRRDPALADDRAAIDELATDTEAFPAGTIRTESRLFVAEAWLGRLHRAEAAIGLLRKVSDDVQADPLTVRLAQRELVEALVAQGRVAEAAAEALTHRDRLDPDFVRTMGALARREWVRRGALAVLGSFAAFSSLALARARRAHNLRAAALAVRAATPVAVPFSAFIALGGGLLAARYESGNARPFLLLGASLLPLMLLARAWSAVGSPRPAARIGRAALCATTVLAAAFVLLDVATPVYLEGFGL